MDVHDSIRDSALAQDIDFDAHDERFDAKSDDTDFDAVVAAALSRRGFLGGILAVGSAAALGSTTVLTGPAEAASRFGFEAVAADTADTITVPKGYRSSVVARWGDPLFASSAPFDEETRGTAATQALAFGDNNDGMSVFSHEGRSVLVVNNEYTNRRVLWGNRAEGLPETEDDVEKGMMAHGVTVAEIARKPDGDGWSIVQGSPLNRRITPRTPMELTGPARGSDLVKTAADPEGVTSLGTWNNCGNGRTPWGTYLACEENFNGYFSATGEEAVADERYARYGVRAKDWGYGWARVDERFDVAKHPNEPHRAGYVVEIDPLDPASTPRKRTALGRFKHENAEVVVNGDGRVVVYMGDDERGEFLYRFVSDGVYRAGGDNGALLETGTLYAARFDADGRGTWLPLTPDATGMAADEIAVFTRQAASKMGATTMDRPEWVAANPVKAELYCALTNNKNRGLKSNAGGDATPVGGPNPREGNRYGQIVRWWPDGGDHRADGFRWDLYVMAGNPAVHDGADAGSANVNEGNMFNSPDGIAFSSTGLLFIQTDGNYTDEGDFAGHGNNQMLVGDPATGEIRRFLVGPNEAEVTGLAWSDDRRTLFVGIQHPGEKGNSNWPQGGDHLPRSAVIAVTREDGGIVG